ncbi:hypothetical protein F5X68DRAFT_11694 [Plectosphaerella plurivora]|uniref:Uncharacterized protein n=1 Tax=Plectosphaerella plurivora TaxID=936078 RepID=A0A9P8VC16_9PEZI|nr:hypothetical protein F5X68DRAFT_11694 [Plectosphaerella plurivora]
MAGLARITPQGRGKLRAELPRREGVRHAEDTRGPVPAVHGLSLDCFRVPSIRSFSSCSHDGPVFGPFLTSAGVCTRIQIKPPRPMPPTVRNSSTRSMRSPCPDSRDRIDPISRRFVLPHPGHHWRLAHVCQISHTTPPCRRRILPREYVQSTRLARPQLRGLGRCAGKATLRDYLRKGGVFGLPQRAPVGCRGQPFTPMLHAHGGYHAEVATDLDMHTTLHFCLFNNQSLTEIYPWLCRPMDLQGASCGLSPHRPMTKMSADPAPWNGCIPRNIIHRSAQIWKQDPRSPARP